MVLIVAAVVALAGCSSGKRQDDGKTHVVAGFYPIAFAAEQIGGPDVEVTNLVPSGVEPHDYEPTVDDLKAVQDADVILYLGGGFQPALEAAIENAPGEKIDLLETINQRHQDPHVWLDPARYGTIARQIGAALDQPAAASAFVARLDELNSEFETGLATCDRRGVITSHDGFRYLTGAYDLYQTPLTGISEASATQLRGIGKLVHITGATTVFVDPLLPSDEAEVIARATGARLETLDPVENSTEGEDYFSIMRTNLAALREGLGCR